MYLNLGVCFREAVIFTTFLLTCVALSNMRYSKRKTFGILSVVLTYVFVSLGFLYGSGKGTMVILTMLPLCAYLPVIISMHVLSKSGFYQTSAVWVIGLFIANSLSFFQKILIAYLPVSGVLKYRIIACLLIILACLCLWYVIKVLRKPFQNNVLDHDANWLALSFPIVMVFLLFSYFKNTTTNFVLLLMVFFTGLSVFLIEARVFLYARKATYLKEEEKRITQQLELQRKECENLCEKLEQGRRYRHDMRHHFRVLHDLAQGEQNEEMRKYIQQLDQSIEENRVVAYCENTIVNAVLSSYLSQAKAIGCLIEHNLRIANSTVFDELDLCMILANALENAIHAIQETQDPKHAKINVAALLDGDDKFVLSITNTCAQAYNFDQEGYPIVKPRQGHGIGLRSIHALTKKYNGFFECVCKDGEFQLKVILFKPVEQQAVSIEKPKETNKTLIASGICISIVSIFIAWVSLSTTNDRANLVEKVSQSYDAVWGSNEFHLVVPKVTLAYVETTDSKENSETANSDQTQGDVEEQKSVSTIVVTPPKTTIWEAGNEGTQKPPEVTVVPPPKVEEKPKPTEPDTPIIKPVEPKPEQPQPPALEDAVEDVNQKIAEYTETCKEKFLWYVSRKYNGYVGMETTYKVIRNDDDLFILNYYGTLNVGGSEEFARFFIIDKQNGKVLELSDMFEEDFNYVQVISDEIKTQMQEQMDADTAFYFLPGGNWPDEECFQAIDVDQNCYINEQNQLVIVFDEYEVAPGSAGMPEFVIPTNIFSEHLKQPTMLK